MAADWVHWRRRLALAFVTAIAVASLAGLRAAAGESATEPSATASRAQTVSMVNFVYRPNPVTVSAGTRVSFVNNSRRGAHTATQNGGGFDTGRVRPGRSAAITFKRPGTFLFHCTLHPFMKGKVVVK